MNTGLHARQSKSYIHIISMNDRIGFRRTYTLREVILVQGQTRTRPVHPKELSLNHAELSLA